MYIFGPVNSRRLGFSLGIDLVPYKTCSYNCIYCECGSTTLITDVVKEYVSTDDVIKELESFLEKGVYKIDYFTFSGSGEPTLAKNIKDIIKYLNRRDINNIAVLTNGSLFYRDEVIENVIEANIIIPSLDAAKEETFNIINRPIKNIKLNDVILGLVKLRKRYKGFLALEIFIIEGINTSDEELSLFKEYIKKIEPDQIQLNTLDRPGIDKSIKKAPYKTLEKIKEFLGHRNTVIVSRRDEGEFFNNNENNVKLLIETIKRRPLTIEDMKVMTGLLPKQIYDILYSLRGKYNISEENINNNTFFKIVD
ncbi:MAG TPA: radical SAM protein [Spirochaetota bacterium]|nr:radical SAM protein [Spirochaetota bacterium]HOM38038.1 radical SAM protein [Spirochaetota bacterium]HPQ48842.1 radical SAM protein [Spirochaetota bacterium]